MLKHFLKASISSGALLPAAVELMPAQRVVFSMVSLLLRIERDSQGRVRICRNVKDIQQALTHVRCSSMRRPVCLGAFLLFIH